MIGQNWLEKKRKTHFGNIQKARHQVQAKYDKIGIAVLSMTQGAYQDDDR